MCGNPWASGSLRATGSSGLHREQSVKKPATSRPRCSFKDRLTQCLQQIGLLRFFKSRATEKPWNWRVLSMAEKLRRRLKIQQLIPCGLIAKSIVPVLFNSPNVNIYNVDQGGNVKIACNQNSSSWLCLASFHCSTSLAGKSTRSKGRINWKFDEWIRAIDINRNSFCGSTTRFKKWFKATINKNVRHTTSVQGEEKPGKPKCQFHLNLWVQFLQ